MYWRYFKAASQSIGTTSKANFDILFSLENIKTENGSFQKNRSRHWRCFIKKVF